MITVSIECYTKLSLLLCGGISGFSASCELKRAPNRDVEVLLDEEVNQLMCGTVVLLPPLLLLRRYARCIVTFAATRTSLVNKQKRQKFITPCALSNILYTEKYDMCNMYKHCSVTVANTGVGTYSKVEGIKI